MTEDWTVDIPLRTPSDRQASEDEVTNTGTVLGRPASLVTKGSSIRLKVSGFDSRSAAEAACPRLCFGLQYMSLHVPIALRLNHKPQNITLYADPKTAATNISASLGGANFGTEVHGIMQDGAPAIYRTGQTILMFTGGEVSFTITGLGEPGQALQWIDQGANLDAAESERDDRLALAVDLFNLSGFEPSPRAAFIVHCTALEQLFPPGQVDAITIAHIERIAKELRQAASTSQPPAESKALSRLRDRILFLKSDSRARAVQDGVVFTLARDDSAHADKLIADAKTIYAVRNKLAHEGRADLGNAPQLMTDILKQVLLKKLSG